MFVESAEWANGGRVARLVRWRVGRTSDRVTENKSKDNPQSSWCVHACQCRADAQLDRRAFARLDDKLNDRINDRKNRWADGWASAYSVTYF